MKAFHLYLNSLLLLFVFINSCSTQEEDSAPPAAAVQTPEPGPPAPNQYTLTVSSGEGGSVTTEGGTYDEGTKVTITATPNEGYEFIKWEGSDLTNESLTITLNSNQNITATFEQLNAIFLDDNGVTIKSYDFAVIGEVYEENLWKNPKYTQLKMKNALVNLEEEELVILSTNFLIYS